MDTIEQLRRQIEEIQVPPLPTQAEQDQIMKGRGKTGSQQDRQADLDAGRKAIADRIKANQDAVTLRSTLTTQLSGMEEKAGQRAREDQAASPEAQQKKALMTLGPSAVGWGSGLTGGLFEKGAQGRAEAERNTQRQALAESMLPRASRMEAADKSGLIPYASKTARGLSRFAPFGAGAAFFGTDAAIAHALQQNAGTQGEKDIYGVARNLFGGLAAGSAHAGVSSVFNPKVSPDADALSKILAPDPTPTPIAGPSGAPAAPSFKSGVEARAYAAEKGVQLPSKLTAAEAMARAEQLKAAADVAQEGSRAGKLISKAGKLGIPAAAGALAYDAASSDAEAAGASPAEARTRGAAAGVGTGAATAGASYGLSKLLEKAPNLARMLGLGAGEMTMPLMSMDVGPNSQEEANFERSRTAVAHPWLARMLGLHDEMGQMLPERNMGKTDEYATARGLQIPEGIPSPRPDGSSPYPDLVSAMMASAQPAAAPPPLPSRRLVDAMMQGR